jgi:hypothetical protein
VRAPKPEARAALSSAPHELRLRAGDVSRVTDEGTGVHGGTVYGPAGRSVSTAHEFDVGKQTVRVDGVAGGCLRHSIPEDRAEQRPGARAGA